MILSIKSMSIIERQINALHARIVETLRRPDLLSTPSSLRGEMAELHTAAFRDLAHNDTLPFFRPHFLEISGGLVTLSRHLDDLVAFLASLKAEERYKLANLSDVFIALGGSSSSSCAPGRTWAPICGRPARHCRGPSPG